MLRLNAYDIERDTARDKNLAVYIAQRVNEILGGESGGSDGDTELL